MEVISQDEPQLSLLYVEDDEDTRELVSRVIMLKFPGVALRTAKNGKEGLDSFRECATDMVLTDINLPLMDGFEMARNIRAIDPLVPFIIITAHSTVNTQEIEGSAINYCLQKPLEYRLLFTSIEECMANLAKIGRNRVREGTGY